MDRGALKTHQTTRDITGAELQLQDAFSTDVRPVIQEWRTSKGLPRNPMDAFRESGYLERITQERSARNQVIVSTYA